MVSMTMQLQWNVWTVTAAQQRTIFLYTPTPTNSSWNFSLRSGRDWRAWPPPSSSGTRRDRPWKVGQWVWLAIHYVVTSCVAFPSVFATINVILNLPLFRSYPQIKIASLKSLKVHIAVPPPSAKTQFPKTLMPMQAQCLSLATSIVNQQCLINIIPPPLSAKTWI